MTYPRSQRRPSSFPPARRLARRVGLIGDVHTEHARLRLAIEHLRGQTIDLLCCTGDIPDGASTPADVDRCCALLRAEDILTISGNHDRWLQDDEMRHLPGATPRDEVSRETLDYLAALPTSAEVETPAGLMLLCHGLGDDDMAQVQAHERGRELETNEQLQALLRSGRYRFVLNGHTHKPGLIELGPLTFINGGTLRRDRSPCCAVIDFEHREVVFFDIPEDGPIAERSHQALRPD